MSVSRRAWQRGLWADHDFRTFWSGETTSLIGTSVAAVTLPLVAIHSLHASTFVITALTAGTWLPWLVLGVPSGGWVDRWPCRPVMLVADVVSLIAFASVPVAASLDLLSVAQLVVVSLLAGSAAVFFSTAYQVFVTALIDGPDLIEANAKLTGSRSAAQVIGPGLGGLIAQLLGAVTGLLADALSFAVSFICLSTVRPIEQGNQSTESEPTSLWSEVRDGLSFLLTDPLLRSFFIYAAVLNFFLTGMNAIEVVFLIRTVKISSAELGLLFAVISVGGLLGAAVAQTLAAHWGTARVTFLSTLLGLPFALLLPLATTGPGVLFWAVGLFTVDCTVVLSNVLVGSFQQSYIPRAMLGRVSSSLSTAAYSMMPAGALIAGLLASTIGVRTALWIFCAGICTSSLILLASPIRYLRDLPTRPTTTVPRPFLAQPPQFP